MPTTETLLLIPALKRLVRQGGELAKVGSINSLITPALWITFDAMDRKRARWYPCRTLTPNQFLLHIMNKALTSITTKTKKLRNRWGHIVDRVLKYIPQPITDTTQKIFSQETKEQVLASFEDAKKLFGDFFSKLKEEDTINLSVEDIPCAQITFHTYDDPFSRPKTIGSYMLVEKYNNIEYCLYRDEKIGKCIIGYRGTEVKEAKDYISDINIVIWTQEFNDRFQESVEVYDTICKEYPDDIKVITGHSLWGTICYMIAKAKDPDRTVVFNPWSSANPTFLLMIKDTQFQAPWTKRVFTYRMMGDIVSSLSAIWYTRTFRKASVNPAELHAVANFNIL
jgi:hypothetical protein